MTGLRLTDEEATALLRWFEIPDPQQRAEAMTNDEYVVIANLELRLAEWAAPAGEDNDV